MRALMVWLWLCLALCGQSAVRMVLADGTYLDVTRAATRADPSVSGDLHGWLVPHGFCILNTGAGTSDFRTVVGLYDQGRRPLIPGARNVRDVPGLWLAIPRGEHKLYVGEMLYIADRWPEVVPAGAAKVDRYFAHFFDLALFDEYPRLRQALSLYTWRPDGTSWEGKRTLAWFAHEANYRRRTGAKAGILSGWRNGTTIRWGGGVSNGWYDTGTWQALCWRRSGDDHAYRYGWGLQGQRAALGLMWTGSKAGHWLTEKGNWRRGNGIVSRAKQWSAQAWIWATATGDPVIKAALELRGERITSQVLWNQYWGSRIAARQLEELMEFYWWTGEARYREDAWRRIKNIMTLPHRDKETGLWANLGNGRTAATKVWMQSQLLVAIWRWAQIMGRPVERGILERDLLRSMRALVDLGTFPRAGFLATRYTIPDWGSSGETSGATSVTLTAWMIPVLRALASRDHAYATKFQNAKDTVFRNLGAGWPDLDATPTTVPPVADITIEYHKRGWPGFGKSLQAALMGTRK